MSKNVSKGCREPAEGTLRKVISICSEERKSLAQEEAHSKKESSSCCRGIALYLRTLLRCSMALAKGISGIFKVPIAGKGTISPLRTFIASGRGTPNVWSLSRS